MNTHLICMNIDVWKLMKEGVVIKTMDEIKNAIDEERKLFQENMLAREAIISLLYESELLRSRI